MSRIVLQLFVWCFSASQALANLDSVKVLPEVLAVSSHSVSITDNAMFGSFKFQAGRRLNDALNEQMGVYFKSYGNGQLTSISIRGSSAAQTDLMWNGVSLSSPALGQVDFSLFAAGITDKVELRGNSAYGNIGGHIHLKNELNGDMGFQCNSNLSYGSFNTFRGALVVKYGRKSVSGSSRISYLNSLNNYTFRNVMKPESPVESLSNARVDVLNFMQDFQIAVNRQNSLLISFWLTEAERQVPPIMSKPESREKQNDHSIRTSIAWSGKYGKFKTRFTSAVLQDQINYQNPEIGLNETSKMTAVRNAFEFAVDSLKWFSIRLETGYEFELAMVPAYTTIRKRNIAKLFTAMTYRPTASWNIELGLRQHVYDKLPSPLSPSLIITYQKQLGHQHSLSIHTLASRNFRFPTLNDLYWTPGGNRDLKTEKSWNGEVGFAYHTQKYFNLKANGFVRYVTDWIQWVSNGSYWEPRNFKEVLSRGMEVSAQVQGPFSAISPDLNLGLNLQYNFVRSTNLTATTSYDLSVGKQLIYTPMHTGVLGLHAEYKRFFLRAINTLTDRVFVSNDNSSSLNGYYLLDLELGKDFKIGNTELGCSFRINNATGANYQIVLQRAMPGRSFEGNLRFKFSGK